MPHPSDAVCANHLEDSATFHCQRCRLFFCERCIEHTFHGTGFHDRCRRCGNEVKPLPQRPLPDAAAFVGRLGEIFSFPRGKGVLSLIAGLSLLVAPISWVVEDSAIPILGLLGAIIILGIELSVFFHLVQQSGAGKHDDEIHPGDFSNAWNDIYEPIERLLAAMLPLIGVLFWSHVSLGSVALIASSGLHLAALIAVLMLFPLLLLHAALGGSVFDVLNPLSLARTLRVFGARYWIAAPIFYVLLASYLLWGGLCAPALVSIPMFGRILGLFVGYVFMAMAAKLFGLLLEPHLSR